MKKFVSAVIVITLLLAMLSACGNTAPEQSKTESRNPSGATESIPVSSENTEMNARYSRDTKISDVVNDPVFENFGRLLFPVNTGYYGGNTLGSLQLTWYSHIDPDKTVEIVNFLKDHAIAGDTIFYDIYTEAEKTADPAKKDTGLFFFKGKPGEKFAICKEVRWPCNTPASHSARHSGLWR